MEAQGRFMFACGAPAPDLKPLGFFIPMLIYSPEAEAKAEAEASAHLNPEPHA